MMGATFIAKEIYDSMRREIAKQVKVELRHAPDRRLKLIVRAYEKHQKKLPWYIKCLNHDFDEIWMRRDLRYGTARDLLSGKFSWEELEKKEEEERLKKQAEIEKDKLRQERIKKARGIDFFIGNLQEYERMKGEEYEIVNVESRWSHNCVFYRAYSPDELERLGAMDIDGLIRFSPTCAGGYGIPVRKVKRK